jgi:hypothetical protein
MGLARVRYVMADVEGIRLRHMLGWLPRVGLSVRHHPGLSACFLAITLASMALILVRAESWPVCIRQLIQGPVFGTRDEERTTELTVPPGAIETLEDALAVSDDFNVCSLDTSVWTFTDEVGDASWDLMGTHTNDAWLSIRVPGEVDHNIWVEGNDAPRILQDVSDTNFEVEVKFESGLNQKYQMEGVLVEQDGEHFLRFDFHSDGAGTRLYAVAFEPDPSSPTLLSPSIKLLPTKIAGNGVAPLYMRVRRQGDQWTLRCSFDGVDWTSGVTFTHAMTVRKVGTYASNADPGGGEPAPAYTGYIDYFFNTVSPIYPEDGARATLAVTVDGAGTVSVVPDKTEYECGDVVTLTAEPDEWFVGWSGDLAGTQNPTTITMDTAKSVKASFSVSPRLYLPLVLTPPFGNYLFAGDFETGDLTGFYWNQNEPEVVRSPHPVRSGSYSMRSYLHRYDSPYSYRTMAIVGENADAPPGTRDHLNLAIGEEYWIGLSVYVPDSFVADSLGCDELWWELQAQPDAGEEFRSPILALYVSAGNATVLSRWDTRGTSSDNTFSGSESIVTVPVSSMKGKWTDWVVHVYWSWHYDGWLEVYRDGAMIGQRNGPNCSNDREGPYMSIGVYKWPWREGEPSGGNCGNSIVERLIYVDELRIAGADADYDAVASPTAAKQASSSEAQ